MPHTTGYTLFIIANVYWIAMLFAKSVCREWISFNNSLRTVVTDEISTEGIVHIY